MSLEGRLGVSGMVLEADLELVKLFAVSLTPSCLLNPCKSGLRVSRVDGHERFENWHD